MLSIHAFFSVINFAVLGPTCIYIWRKVVPGKSVTIPAESTAENV